MRYSIALSRDRRANVWLNETPPGEFVATSARARVLNPTRQTAACRTIAAIEMSIPHGANASYALLGAELLSRDIDGLDIVVPTCSNGSPYASSLAVMPDTIQVGLPDEYSEAVFAGVQNFANSHGVPVHASLRFRWAAHGLVGSSPHIFSMVSSNVVQLLTLREDLSQSDLVGLFDSYR